MAKKTKCWIWFRNGLNQSGSWASGWMGSPSDLGGIRIEHFEFNIGGAYVGERTPVFVYCSEYGTYWIGDEPFE